MNYKPIIDAYVRRIRRGEITIDDVPEIIREDVRKQLEGDYTSPFRFSNCYDLCYTYI